VVGGWISVRAVQRKYHDRLRRGRMNHRTRLLVDVAGVAGGVARGLVLAAAGVFAVRAAVECVLFRNVTPATGLNRAVWETRRG
jgi:hypothetical protein